MALPLVTTQRHARAEEGLALAWQAVPGAMRYGLIIGLPDVPLPPLDVVMKGALRSFTIMGIPVRFTGAVDVGSPVGEDRQYSLIAYRGDGTIVPVPGVGYYPARQAPRDRDYHLLQPPALAAEPQPVPAPPQPAPEPMSDPDAALDEFGDPLPVVAAPDAASVAPIDPSDGPTGVPTGSIPAQDAAPVERRPQVEFAAATAGPAQDAGLLDSAEEAPSTPAPSVTAEPAPASPATADAADAADGMLGPPRTASKTASPAEDTPLFATAVSADDTMRQPAAEPTGTVPATVERQDGGTGWSDAASGRQTADELETAPAPTVAPAVTEPATSEDQAGRVDEDRIGRESKDRGVGAGEDQAAGEIRDDGVRVERPAGNAPARAHELAALLDEAELHLRWSGGDEREVARLLDQAGALAPTHSRLRELRDRLRRRQKEGARDAAPPSAERLLAEARRSLDTGDYWLAVDLYAQVLAVQEHNDEARQGAERARTLALWTALMAGARRDAKRLRRIGDEFVRAPDLALQSFEASFSLRPTVAALQGWLLGLARDGQWDNAAEAARQGVGTLRACGRVEGSATPAQERALARIQSEARAGAPGSLSAVADAVADLAAALEAVRLSAD